MLAGLVSSLPRPPAPQAKTPEAKRLARRVPVPRLARAAEPSPAVASAALHAATSCLPTPPLQAQQARPLFLCSAAQYIESSHRLKCSPTLPLPP